MFQNLWQSPLFLLLPFQKIVFNKEPDIKHWKYCSYRKPWGLHEVSIFIVRQMYIYSLLCNIVLYVSNHFLAHLQGSKHVGLCYTIVYLSDYKYR
jgi:hypothetical protein